MGQSLNYRIIKKTNNTGSSGRRPIKVISRGGGKGRREGGVGLDAEGKKGQGRGQHEGRFRRQLATWVWRGDKGGSGIEKDDSE